MLGRNSDGTCNWCDGDYATCKCGTRSKEVKHEPIKYSKSEPKVTKGDVICSGITDKGRILKESYVNEITAEGNIICKNIGLNTSENYLFIWEGPYLRICSAMLEH